MATSSFMRRPPERPGRAHRAARLAPRRWRWRRRWPRGPFPCRPFWQPSDGDQAKLRPSIGVLAERRGDGARRRLLGVVAGPGEGRGLDVADAHRLADPLELVELLGRHPTGHRHVVGGRPQVLARASRCRCRCRARSASAPATSSSVSPMPRIRPLLVVRPARLGPGQHGQAAGVVGRRAHGPLQAGHGLHVVVQHVGPGVEDGVEGVARPLAVGDQDLDGGPRLAAADGADGLGERCRAAIGEVVAGHHRDARRGPGPCGPTASATRSGSS